MKWVSYFDDSKPTAGVTVLVKLIKLQVKMLLTERWGNAIQLMPHKFFNNKYLYVISVSIRKLLLANQHIYDLEILDSSDIDITGITSVMLAIFQCYGVVLPLQHVNSFNFPISIGQTANKMYVSTDKIENKMTKQMSSQLRKKWGKNQATWKIKPAYVILMSVPFVFCIKRVCVCVLVRAFECHLVLTKGMTYWI